MGAIPLNPISIIPNAPVFNAMATWPFEDEFISRILIQDIPQRVKYGAAQVWAYLDPQNSIVGFGSLAIGNDCSQFTDGKPHTYIPLLAVNPDMRGQGHGKSILSHLIEEAARVVAAGEGLHHAVFLDVYERSTIAIKLYTGCGFVTLNGPIVDPVNSEKFFVMAKRVSA